MWLFKPVSRIQSLICRGGELSDKLTYCQFYQYRRDFGNKGKSSFYKNNNPSLVEIGINCLDKVESLRLAKGFVFEPFKIFIRFLLRMVFIKVACHNLNAEESFSLGEVID